MAGLKTILLFCAVLGVILVNPTGASIAISCDDMTPNITATAQTSDVDYDVVCEFTRAASHWRVHVDVKPKEGAVGDRAVFKGVMIQLRDSEDHPRGHLPRKRELHDDHFVHACQHKAVTHKNDEDKVHARQIVFRLNRRERHMENLQCVVTVVRDDDTFWVQKRFDITENHNGERPDGEDTRSSL